MLKRTLFPALLAIALPGCGDDETGESGTDSGSSSTSTSGPVTETTPTTGPGVTTDDASTSDGTSSSGGADDSSSGGGSSSSGSEGSSSGGSSSSTGEPLLPEIEVSFDAVAVADGDSYAFGETVDVGAMGAPVEVTVENTGTADLNLGVVDLGGATEFVLDSGMLDAVVTPGGSTTFTITFTPTNGGAKSAVLNIPSDDADEADYDVTLGAHTTPNTYRVLAPGAAPSARFNASMASLGDGRVMLFGGRGMVGARLNDTWMYDVAANTWTQSAPATPPGPRDSHALARTGDTVILYGGFNGSVLGDTWAFDVMTGEWSEVMPATAPGGRFQASMTALDDGTLLLFGGRDPGLVQLDETWHYDVAGESWSNAMPATSPPPRYASTMAYDGNGAVTLFGGYENVAGFPLGDTWRYDVVGNDWSMAMPGNTPGIWFAQVGAHYASGAFIVHSGKEDTCCNDPDPGTWAYDPVMDDWADITPASEPTPRFQAAIAAIEGTNKSIIFGGNFVNIGPAGATDQTLEYVGPLP